MMKMKLTHCLNESRSFIILCLLFCSLVSVKSSAQIIEGRSEKVQLNFTKSGNLKQSAEFGNTEDIQYYALLIAIDDYSDPNIPQLNEPVKDATKLYEVLTKTYTFSETNTLFLKNPTREQIINSFDSLRKVITPNDNLLIYYAGHGLYDKDSEVGYWLPTDAKLKNRASWLFNSTLVDCIKSIKSKHILLVSDACFSGSIILRDVGLYGNADQSVQKLYSLNSRKAMTSGNLETVMDKSPFNKYLVKSLSDNTKQYINANELYVNLREAVINSTPNAQNPQFGIIIGTGDQGGEFIFIRR
jgi:hypothetical protein